MNIKQNPKIESSIEPQSKEANSVILVSFWKSKQTLLFGAVILILSFIVYLPSLQSRFVNWDDDWLIYENKNLINIEKPEDLVSSLKEIFITNPTGSYKPLVMLSFAIEKLFFGFEKPSLWHLNNIILHLVCVLLIFRIALALGLKIIPAAFCALLFGIHPMRVESVAWLTERKDVLYGAFYLLALYYYIKSVKISFRKRYLLIILISFILSLLSKIQAVTLPLSMLLIDYFFGRKMRVKLIIEKWPFFLLSLIRGIVGSFILSRLNVFDENVLYGNVNASFLFRIIASSYAYVVYIVKSVFPYEIIIYYPYPSSLGWIHYICLFFVFLIILTVCYFHKKSTKVIFGLMFFTFNIIFLLHLKGLSSSSFLADRYTYVAYFGLFFLFAYGLQKALYNYKNFSKFIYFVTMLILAVFGYMNFEQNKIWKDGETLWSHALEHYPNDFGMWSRRADFYVEKGRFGQALHDYNKAINLNPNILELYHKRGKLYYETGDPNKLRLAVNDFSQLIHFAPGRIDYLIDRAITYIQLNMYDNALQDLNAAEKIDSSEPLVFFNRAIVFQNYGRHDRVQADLEKYVNLNPNDPKIWSNLGLASKFNGKYEKSLNAFKKAIQLAPNELSNYYRRAMTYYEMGDIEQARNDLNFLKSQGFKGISPEYERLLQ